MPRFASLHQLQVDGNHVSSLSHRMGFCGRGCAQEPRKLLRPSAGLDGPYVEGVYGCGSGIYHIAR